MNLDEWLPMLFGPVIAFIPYLRGSPCSQSEYWGDRDWLMSTDPVIRSAWCVVHLLLDALMCNVKIFALHAPSRRPVLVSLSHASLFLIFQTLFLKPLDN